MNKSININLGGIFFHIDEIAYEKLRKYLDAIRRSLSDDPQGRDEIITDIESRISELLSEKVKDIRQVVSENDIEEVIEVMGQPEDYMVDEELFTDDSGKNYRSKSASRKKLFRDGDDRFLGGVSSGLAYYFDVDVIWIRIAWLVATFGLGFGPLLYIILWILLPEAKTTADKLQMEGEPVNISNIEKRVRAEFESASESVKGAVNDAGEKIKEGYENVSDSLKKKDLKKGSTRARSGLQDFIDTIGKIIVTLFMVIGKFIGVILIFVSVVTLIALVISLFTAGAVDFMGVDSLFDGDFQIINPTGVPTWVVSILVLILVGIPFLTLFFLGLFILSNKTRILSRTAKFVLLGVWIIALLTAIYLGVRQAAEFAYEGSAIEQKELAISPLDTITIKMLDDEVLSNNSDFNHRTFFRKVLDADDNPKFYSNDVNIYIRQSDSTEAYVKVRKEANGRSRMVARENAEQIEYKVDLMGKNLLLNSYFLTDAKNTFRNQDLRVTLYLPIGQVIYLDESTKVFLRYIKTTGDIYRRDMAEHTFKMTKEGLECLDCKDDIWRYDQGDNDFEDGVNLNIDEDGVELKIKDDGEQAEVKIDENGIRIK